MLRVHLELQGIVQGVGFRPFVLRVALREGLVGFVFNDSRGVEIEVEGEERAIEALREALREELPSAARIDRLVERPVEPRGSSGFEIIESEARAGEAALISPDLAPCPDCLAEMSDPGDRRYLYPFINCTACGPRFTVVREVPYDRPSTTMAPFELCPRCRGEYLDPMDRRFHAQPVACPVCGPTLTLEQRGEEDIPGISAVSLARALLSDGAILAVKGVGGYLLCCDAGNEAAVRRLRERKQRPDRPLALLARDTETARQICVLGDMERQELESRARPILLLRRRTDSVFAVAPSIAPGHRFLGVMLPSAPLLELLVRAGDPPSPSLVVATSGNRSGAPLARTEAQARDALGGVADALLTHDREIWNRCDDSVGWIANLPESVGGPRLVLARRSRGYAPAPMELPFDVPPTLAVGAMLSSTVLLASGHRAFFSQHIGDTEDLDVQDFMEETIAKLRRWLKIDPRFVVRDLHPDVPSSRLANRLGEECTVIAVQHHHAHLASAALAAGLPPQEHVIALVLDGTGLGPDRAIWGCELLWGNARSALRWGHLAEMPLPGGDRSIRRPQRIAAAWCHALGLDGAWDATPACAAFSAAETAVVRQMVDRRFHTPLCTSAGRLFDVASVILGWAGEITYEGQAAIELEQAAWRARRPASLEMRLCEREAGWILDPQHLLRGLLQGVREGLDREELALGFHHALARALVEAACAMRESLGPARVLLAGGVFQNRILVDLTVQGLEQAGMSVLPPGRVPVGDGGLALGQLLVAHAGGPGSPGELLFQGSPRA